MSTENREEPRRWVYDAAKIVQNGEIVLDCTILDISRSGVRIGVDLGRRLPAQFDLVDLRHQRAFEARLVWRRSLEAGLRIETDLSPWWFRSTSIA